MGESRGPAVPIDTGQTVLPARISLTGGALFVALLSLSHLLKPDVDPSWTPISAQALGPFGGLMTSAFIALGVSALGLVVALLGAVQSRAGKIGLGFLVIGATGLFLGALFPMDPLATPMHEISTAGTIHSIGAVLGDAFPIAAALITWSLVRTRPEWAAYRAPLIGSAVVTWAGLIAMTASMVVLMPPSGELGPDVPVGWQNRAMMLAYAAWLMTASWVATRTASEIQADAPSGSAQRRASGAFGR